MLVLMTCTLLSPRRSRCIGGVIMAAARGRPPVAGSWRSASRARPRASGLVVVADGPAVPAMQDPHRPGQPGAARADHRHPRRAGVRPRARRARALRRGQRRRSPTRRCGPGGCMAWMFPIVMLVLNGSSVAVLWFGGDRIGSRPHADRRADRLPQLPRPDPDGGDDGHVHGRAGAPGRRCAPSASTRSSTPPSSVGRHRPAPVTELRDPGHARAARRRLPLPGRRGSRCCSDISLRAVAGPDHRHHRQHRLGQDHAAQPVPRLFDATDGHGAGRRRRRARPRPRAAVEPHRPGAPEAVPVLRHRGQQPALRQPRRHRRRAVGGARGRPGPRLRVGHARRLDAPITQGGSNVSGGQRQRLAIARALVRKPEIYLFDDSFSALDLATDARLRAALAPTPPTPRW